MIISGVSLNTQANDSMALTFESNLERHIARMKAEALVSLDYQLRAELLAPKKMFLGEVVKTSAVLPKMVESNLVTFENSAVSAD